MEEVSPAGLEHIKHRQRRFEAYPKGLEKERLIYVFYEGGEVEYSILPFPLINIHRQNLKTKIGHKIDSSSLSNPEYPRTYLPIRIRLIIGLLRSAVY